MGCGMSNEVTTIPDRDIEVHANMSPAQMMQMALAQKQDLAGLKELLELQKEYEAHEAKKAYVKAMSKFRAEGVIVSKDKENKQYGSRYTSLGNLVNSAIPALSKHGLSHKWETAQEGDVIRVTCVMTHEAGHSESTTMEGPPDASGSKNALQKIKSTVTYLKLATFEAITGLASVEGNLDDDGNATGSEFVTSEQAATINRLVKESNAKLKPFLTFAGAETVDTILASNYNKVVRELNRKIAAIKKPEREPGSDDE